MNNYGMTYIEFKNDLEALDKLKSVGLLTKTKTLSSLNQILYKQINDGNIKTYTCKVVGFNYKENPSNCINQTYENLKIKVNDNEFDINIDFLKDMQKKSWGNEGYLEEN